MSNNISTTPLVDNSSFVKGWSQSTIGASESLKKKSLHKIRKIDMMWIEVPYKLMIYLISKHQLRLLLFLNQSNEVKMFQEAVGGVDSWLLLLKQIPSRIPSSTSPPYVDVSKIAYYETIPKMWNCGLLRLLCQILSN